MWPWDFSNRLSLIKCFYSLEKNKNNLPPKPIIFRTMTFPLVFQKVFPFLEYFPQRIFFHQGLWREPPLLFPVCVDLQEERIPGWQPTVKLFSWLLCFSFAPSTFLSLSGRCRSEGRDGAFDFPMFAVLGRPSPALLELALK